MTDFSNIGAINGVPQKLAGGGYYTKDEMDEILRSEAEWIVDHVRLGAHNKSLPPPEPPPVNPMDWGKAPIFSICASLDFIETEIEIEAWNDDEEWNALDNARDAIKEALEYIVKYYELKKRHID